MTTAVRSTIWELNRERTRFLPENVEGLRAVQGTELFCAQSSSNDEQQRSAEQWEGILDVRHPGWRSRIGRLAESPLTPREYCFTFHGRVVSLDFYKKLNLALEVLRSKPRRVIEIGAGWGQVGRILWELDEVDYTVIDLPESLRWAKVFLFGSNVPATFVPAEGYKDHTAGSYDCLLNSSSMGEMPRSVAADYLNWFIPSRVFRAVLLNRLLNTYDPWREHARENEAGWYFHVPRVYIERWELEPNFTRIAGPEFSDHHRELLLVTQSDGVSYVPSLDEVAQQSWNTHYSDSPSSRTSNILWPDKETLRVLLENVRCEPTPGSIELLLRYLHCIRLAHPFEEVPLLRRMLNGERVSLSHLQAVTSTVARFLWKIKKS